MLVSLANMVLMPNTIKNDLALAYDLYLKAAEMIQSFLKVIVSKT